MIYLAYLFMAFLGLRLLISLVNLISWHYLPHKCTSKYTDKVSVLIPARNEENNVRRLLEDFSKFSYENLEILIYDDESADNTAKVVKEFNSKDKRIMLVPGVALPDGWLGKNHACHYLAQQATGDYLLFIDADVRVNKGLLERSICYLQRKKLHLVSIFPQQIMLTTGEKMTVPLMNWILLTFLPLFLIRVSRWTSFSAANGQFMFFRADTYKQTLPHQKHSSHAVEDIAILRYFKKKRLRVDTLLGNQYIRCRMYTNLHDAKEGFSKNMIHFFGNNKALALFFGLVSSLAFPVVILIMGLQIGLLYLAGIIITRVLVSLASRQSVIMNLIYLLPQQYMLINILINAAIKQHRKTLSWKNRIIG